MDFNPVTAEKKRTFSESGLKVIQGAEDRATDTGLIEISEEAYKKNNIYRPWSGNEAGQKKESNESDSEEVAPAMAEDLDAA